MPAFFRAIPHNEAMEERVIHHAPRKIEFLVTRGLEIERDICDCPPNQDRSAVRCPECGCVMMYRGLGRLGTGSLVHAFECVHSHREVHSLSIVVSE